MSRSDVEKNVRFAERSGLAVDCGACNKHFGACDCMAWMGWYGTALHCITSAWHELVLSESEPLNGLSSLLTYLTLSLALHRSEVRG